MIDQYSIENSNLLNNIVQNTFFAGYRENYNNLDSEKYINYKSLEFIVNGYCDLRCKYCYITRHGDQLYPKDIHKDTKNILENAKAMLDYLEENKLLPREIALFSGDPLMQNVGLDVLDLLIDFYSKFGRGTITVPTNFNFVHYDHLIDRVRGAIKRGSDNNVRVFLSASVDGLYCDKNRPFKNTEKARDYDKIFAFAKEVQGAFHPMVYCEEIELWKDNFLWFQEKFKEYDIPWDAIYLLEVRNYEWKQKQMKEYYHFLQFVVDFIYKKINIPDPIQFMTYIFKSCVMNMFSLFGSIGRGIGCSIQNTIQLRLADLSVFPCHRNTYPYYKLFEFTKENGKITGINGINPELFSAVQATNIADLSYCQNCIVKGLCLGQCLGSMHEVTNDLFTPIPIVCQLEHVKCAAIINKLYDLNVFPEGMKLLGPQKQNAIEMVRNLAKEIKL